MQSLTSDLGRYAEKKSLKIVLFNMEILFRIDCVLIQTETEI